MLTKCVHTSKNGKKADSLNFLKTFSHSQPSLELPAGWHLAGLLKTQLCGGTEQEYPLPSKRLCQYGQGILHTKRWTSSLAQEDWLQMSFQHASWGSNKITLALCQANPNRGQVRSLPMARTATIHQNLFSPSQSPYPFLLHSCTVGWITLSQ